MKFDEILRTLSIPFAEPGQHHHTREGWINIDCPYCSVPGSQKWHLGYNIAYGYMNCWRCGPHNVEDALKLSTNLSWQRVRDLTKDLEFEDVGIREIEGKLEIPYKPGPLLQAHIEYLTNRRFHPQKLEELWGIKGYGPTALDNLQWRIFIPIHLHGQVVSWTTRSISEDENAKYKTASPEQELVHHKDLLFGEDYCRHAIVVVEGPLDVFAIGPGAAATFGLQYSRKQLSRISKYTSRAICFDNEPLAQRRARQLCDDLQCFPGRTHNVVLSGKDASRSPKNEVAALRKEFLGD